MSLKILYRILAFVVLVLAQALVLNHIHLLGVATPMLYVWFVLLFRRNLPRWVSLLTSFFLGLCIDVLSNTPGVATGAMTFVAFLQPYVLELFLQRESEDNFEPGMRTMGFGKFFVYTLLLVLAYMLVFYSLEAFDFFNWQHWLIGVGGSTLLTVILILVIENLRGR